MSSTPEAQELLIVTGMSGAGRSTVADALEDLGWYVVDNLPPLMLGPLLDLGTQEGTAFPRIAAVVDIRGGRLLDDLAAALATLRDGRLPIQTLFLDAEDEVLVRRFEQVRRPHPLQGDGTLLDGIRAERARISDIRASSDLVIDTSSLNVHQLTDRVRQAFASRDESALQLTIVSFGFKYGLPADVDAVADARFLPNPHWTPELRPLTGQDARVQEFVFAQQGAEEFLDAYARMLEVTIDGYQRENKRNAAVAIGCTGGKHRSVAIAQRLAERLGAIPGIAITVRHRDLGRE
ncbi:MAG TPA: RNase adapter RapZ [Microbacteriaceae bacterium]|nr:RNase adapter RapZ [Microbacteriaceae bacterium]